MDDVPSPRPRAQATRQGRGRATIRDVALRAGVTKGTVSKYLNSGAGYYVAAETRARIEAAIRELDFEPNAIAQGLTQNRTMTIGLIAADIRNPFYPDLVAGVQQVVEREGYTLILGSSGYDPERERAIVRSMSRRHVDGVILGSARLQASEVEELLASGMRVVLASRGLPDLVTDTVVVDNRAGAELAVDHLVALGHTRIGHIAGPQNVVPFRDRLEGFRAAMRRHGLQIDESLVIETASKTEDGANAARSLLGRADRPSAVFVGNDVMALGVMDTARKLGLQIPGDISIVGFDNIALAENSFISLTSVDSDAAFLGGEAARILLERLRAGDVPPYQAARLVVHEARLLPRGTTGPPSA